MKILSRILMTGLCVVAVCCHFFEFDPIILANGTSPEDWYMDLYFIDEVAIDADTLEIVVTYPGGCEEHEFQLIAWSYFMESYPVQANILLSHNANGDTCEAAITEELRFDLSPLKWEYQDAYQVESDTIILRLLNLNGEDFIPIEYVF